VGILNLKVKHVLIPLIMIIIVFIGLTTVNNKDNNLKCDIAAIKTNSKEGKPAVVLVFDYKWSKMPMRLSPDTLKIGFPEGWRIEDYSITINGKDVTDKFNDDFADRKSDLTLHFNSNSNFLSEENFRGKIVLVPEDSLAIDSKFYSAASLKYIHKSLFNTIAEGDSVGWENKSLLSEK
jgi:hypothetical protein